jgi:Ni,Fe-hydrogenase III small subunit/Pyruvate/2-oxoacid:ferredoxin oxidoreductase delta subunit
MLKVILARFQQKYRTMKYPAGEAPPLPDRFRGRPEIAAGACAAKCEACALACPTRAIEARAPAVSAATAAGAGPAAGAATPARAAGTVAGAATAAGATTAARAATTATAGPRLDLGKCLFCGDCVAACPEGAISFTRDHRLATRSREALVIGPGERELELAAELDRRLKRLFGRSLKLRQVSAGGCGACEADSNVLTTVGWDISRFGIQFVASPRHADALLVTGPVSRNMELALRKTYDAMCEPKLVIAVGSCAISGGPYIGREEVLGGAAELPLEGGGKLPVDLFVPGCPPHPLTILDGLLRLLGRLERK